LNPCWELSRRRFLQLGLLAAAAPKTLLLAGHPVRRGAPQLFVDDLLIEAGDFRRELMLPVKEPRPVLALTDEFRLPATLEANGSIVYDPRLRRYVMFGLGYCRGLNDGERGVRLYRFTSAEGVQWVKGDTGRAQEIPLDVGGAANIDVCSFCYVPNNPFPYQGWIFLANWPGHEGAWYYRSVDGLRWERVRQVFAAEARTVEQEGRVFLGPGDVNMFSRDPVTNRYLASFRFIDRARPNGLLELSRGYAFIDDPGAPVDWQKIRRVALTPGKTDEPYDEFYGSTGWRYGSHFLGGLRVWHGSGDYRYSAAGCAYLKLVSSRDGLRWRKVSADPFLPNSPEGTGDGGYMTEFSQGPLAVGDRLAYYYGASAWGKNHPVGQRVTGGGIFRAWLRRDGFAAVTDGTLRTRPLALPPGVLTVNSQGPVRIKVGKNLPVSVRGDSVARKVAQVSGTTTLRFEVPAGSRLYSFTVR
jgi:hypothetical protein